MAASVRKGQCLLLPAAAQFETRFRTASNRSAAMARESDRATVRVKPDHTIVRLRQEVRLCRRVRQNVKLDKDAKGWDEPNVEDICADQPRHVDDRLQRPVARAACR